MYDATVEQKLQLLRQVRSRYQENQYDMSNRERILYGRTGFTPEREYPYEDEMPLGEAPFSFFRLRFLIAALLLAAVIIMDKNGTNLAGITSEKIFEMISADYGEQVEEWVETLSFSVDN